MFLSMLLKIILKGSALWCIGLSCHIWSWHLICTPVMGFWLKCWLLHFRSSSVVRHLGKQRVFEVYSWDKADHTQPRLSCSQCTFITKLLIFPCTPCSMNSLPHLSKQWVSLSQVFRLKTLSPIFHSIYLIIRKCWWCYLPNMTRIWPFLITSTPLPPCSSHHYFLPRLFH